MGEFDLSPEELKGFDLTPGEAAPKSKYPTPKSLTKTDDELGLSFGPQDTRTPGKNQALYAGKGTNGLSTEPELSPVEKQLKDKFGSDIDFAKEIAPYLVGGIVGKGIGMVAGRVAAKPASAAVKEASEVMSQAINNTASSHLNAAILKSIGILAGPQIEAAGKAIPAIARSTSAGVAAGARGTGAVAAGGTASGTQAEGEARPYRGVFSNAVERLRASAAGNPRAADLISRIDRPPIDNGAGTETVTQTP